MGFHGEGGGSGGNAWQGLKGVTAGCALWEILSPRRSQGEAELGPEQTSRRGHQQLT